MQVGIAVWKSLSGMKDLIHSEAMSTIRQPVPERRRH